MYDADFAAFQDLLNKSKREEGVLQSFTTVRSKPET